MSLNGHSLPDYLTNMDLLIFYPPTTTLDGSDSVESAHHSSSNTMDLGFPLIAA